MIDLRAFLILLLLFLPFLILWHWGSRFSPPHLKYSALASFENLSQSWKQKWEKLPRVLMWCALVFFCLAFIDPHHYLPKTTSGEKEAPIKQVNVPSEGIAIYLVLDQSGSMAGEIKAPSSAGRWIKQTKMDLLKQVSKDFVQGNPRLGLQGRASDMLGLVAFARGAQVLTPLTLDHQAILQQLEKLQYTTDMSMDGTSIGYSIFKTAHLIAATRLYAQTLAGEGKPAYEIKSSIMIVVTDGLQAPNPLDKGKRLRNIDLIESAEFAKKENIRVYFVNVEPRIASEEFAAHRSLMQKAASITGGRFYLVDSAMSLDKIYADIDQLEKSRLPIEIQYATPPKEELPHLYQRASYYPYLVGLGLCFLLSSIVLECTWMRRVP